MRRVLALALLVVFVSAAGAQAAKASRRLKNNLLSVVVPTVGEPAHAHPFVNVIVLFGQLADGTPADPGTFHARIGREDVTNLFEALSDGRRQIGVRGALEPKLVKMGRRPRNRLRLMILAKRSGKGPRIRDVDRLRFAAIEAPNQPCVAQADTNAQVIVPGVGIAFTGSKATVDPDRDELTYLWDFGDGQTSTDADPTHVYDVQQDQVTATLTASDGQTSCKDTVTLEAVPPLPEGTVAGILRIGDVMDPNLEFASIAPGGNATKTITLTNEDAEPNHVVPLRLASTNPGFTPSETELILGPGESHPLTITFAPQAAGHQHARISFVANASNRQAVSVLAHGFGGTGPGVGPTFAGDPFFYTDVVPSLLGLGTFGVMPDGRKFFADNGVHTCSVPGNGLGTGDFCLTDQDCAANGGTCTTTSACISRDPSVQGRPCSMPSDCTPNGYCPSYTTFDPVDLCSDGQSVFLMSDEGTFSEPDPNAETERAVTVMRLDLDATGNVTGKDILDRTTTETAHLACDGFAAGQGGQIYIPEFHNVPDSGDCFRSEREALVKIAKGNGGTQVVAPRIDAYEGLGDCDDLDPVEQLEVTRDGSKMFAGFESGGLWQIRPTPLFFSPDITDTYQVHPDGSVLYAATTDSGSTGLVNLYRITPDEVQHGALPYTALVPCASFAVPNNGGRSVVIGFAADRSAVGSHDATALVSFVASFQGQVLASPLLVRGTVAFSAPAGTTTCTAEGLVNLEVLELAF